MPPAPPVALDSPRFPVSALAPAPAARFRLTPGRRLGYKRRIPVPAGGRGSTLPKAKGWIATSGPSEGRRASGNLGFTGGDTMQIGKGVLLVMLLLAPGAVSAQAAGYPERPVRMVVPFPPGGSTDFTARIVAQQMEKILGQPVVVENKVGNLGIAALQELANADAYTLMVGNVITNSLTPVVYRKRLPFNYDAAIQP